MQIILGIIAVLFGIAGFVASIIILIDAFKDAVWKGLVAVLCGLYFLYYALAEFEHDRKLEIVILALAGNGICFGLLRFASGG